MEIRTTKNNQKLPSASAWKIWVVFFAWTLITGLAIQLVILPYIFPSWHAGHGLLAGTDFSYFHEETVNHANKIRAEGWTAWRVFQSGQAVIGISSVFYVLIAPEPWTVLPLNAILHATAGILLLQMINLLLKDWKKAFFAVLPFVVFPSSLTWTAQMHNDSYAILGGLFLIYGWMSISRPESWASWRGVLKSVLLVASGVLLIWLVRSYLVQVLQAIAGVVAILLTVIFIIRWIKNPQNWKREIAAIITIWVLVVAMTPFTGVLFKKNVEVSSEVAKETSESPHQFVWQRISWIPAPLDSPIRALIYKRWRTSRTWNLSSNQSSNIDIDIELHNTLDVVTYLPRATQIAFLSPFPADWFESGSQGSSAMMRRVSGLEMSLVYLALLGFPFAIWKWGGQIEMWVLIIFCSAMLIVYALSVPNMGTLYRFRYAYLMTMAALGLAAWAKVGGAWYSNRNQ